MPLVVNFFLGLIPLRRQYHLFEMFQLIKQGVKAMEGIILLKHLKELGQLGKP